MGSGRATVVDSVLREKGMAIKGKKMSSYCPQHRVVKKRGHKCHNYVRNCQKTVA